MADTDTSTETGRTSRVPTDPVMRNRYLAIMAAGTYTSVAEQMGFSRGEAVRQWTINRDPTPQQARKLIELGGNQFTLEQILPTVFSGLTVKELGYDPK